MCGQYFDGMSNRFVSREMEQGRALPTPGIDLVLQHHKERVGKWVRIKTEGSSNVMLWMQAATETHRRR